MFIQLIGVSIKSSNGEFDDRAGDSRRDQVCGHRTASTKSSIWKSNTVIRSRLDFVVDDSSRFLDVFLDFDQMLQRFTSVFTLSDFRNCSGLFRKIFGIIHIQNPEIISEEGPCISAADDDAVGSSVGI